MSMKYTLIRAFEFNFEDEVNAKIKDGWEPIGGVGVTMCDSINAHPLTGEQTKDVTLYQAMIKR